jgi:hypothetical protein
MQTAASVRGRCPWRRAVGLAGLILAGLVGAPEARASEALWTLLRQGGQVVLLRHSPTDPGVGEGVISCGRLLAYF